MAFNPFHSFRKNSKYIFAALAIICMFTFVLSSGLGQGGDFFDWLGRLLGRTDHRKGAEVAKIFDKPVHEADLAAIRLNRRIANEFMLAAVERAHINAMKQVLNDITNKRVSDDVAKQVDAVVKGKIPPEEGGDARSRAMYNQQILLGLQINQPFFFVNQMKAQLQRIDRTKSPADYQALAEAIQVFQYDIERLSRPRGEYFSTIPIGGPREALLFELFLRKADQMDVPRLNNEDVRNLVNAETNNRVRDADFAVIEQMLRRGYQKVGTDQLMAALADEFRLRIAETSLMGKGGLVLGPRPGYVTPYEFYQFYRDNCTPIKVDLIAVPTQAFVSKVTEAPPESELRALYDQNRTFEADPALERPGFKEPRKMKLEWVAVAPDLPYYVRKLADVNAAVAAVAGPCPPAGLDLAAFGARYNRMADKQRSDWEKWLTNDLHDTSVLNPLTIATLTGHLAAAGPTHAGALPGLASFSNMARAIEVRDRAKVGVQLLLGPMQPLAALPTSPPKGGFAPGALGAAATGVAAYELDRKYRTQEPAPLPLTALASAAAALPSEAALHNLYRAEITKQLRDARLNQLLQADVAKFEARVRELAKGKDGRAAAAKYIAEFIKERGLKHGGSSELDDRFTVAKDPGLKPLIDFDKPRPGDLLPQAEPGRRLIDLFFTRSDSVNTLYQPEWFPTPPTPGVLKADEPYYLVWRSEDKPPRTLSFEQARPRVEAAWRLAKARELAKKAADELAQEAKGLKGNLLALKDFALKKGYSELELGPMAKLQNVHATTVTAAPGLYGPYRVPAALVAHPGPQFADELLALRDKPLGDTVVVADQPKDHYYVAVLVDREERTAQDFMRVYQMTNVPSKGAIPLMSADPLYQQHALVEARDKAAREVIARLKLEANYSENEEVLKRLEESANRSRE